MTARDKIIEAIRDYGAASRAGEGMLAIQLQNRLIRAIDGELLLPLILARQCATALRSQAERDHVDGMPYSREAIELRDLAKQLDLHTSTRAKL